MSGSRLKAALACSDGGHLTELLALRELFEGHDLFYITYRGAMAQSLAPAYYFDRFLKHPLRFIGTWWRVLRILLKERPHVVFSTGAEIAVPVFYLGKFLFGCKLIYLECSAQVATPSLTGRLVYPIADRFFVQWEPLVKRYGPRAEYKGGLI